MFFERKKVRCSTARPGTGGRRLTHMGRLGPLNGEKLKRYGLKEGLGKAVDTSHSCRNQGYRLKKKMSSAGERQEKKKCFPN